jgi:redox-sensitive bicupin YhaK (pirin superfamily)
MNVWDLRLERDGVARLDLPEGWNSMLVVLHGTVQVNDSEIAREGQLVTLDPQGDAVLLEANNEATVLVLSGEPIDEPVVGHGPFVMNSSEEIRQALSDYSSGRFGRIPA